MVRFVASKSRYGSIIKLQFKWVILRGFNTIKLEFAVNMIHIVQGVYVCGHTTVILAIRPRSEARGPGGTGSEVHGGSVLVPLDGPYL